MLTDRQSQVIALVSEGLTNKQIALRLGVKEQVVKVRLRAAMQKVGARTRTQLLYRLEQQVPIDEVSALRRRVAILEIEVRTLRAKLERT
jgi:DNA-binding CsgD family transcriptional regulator